MAHHKKGGLKKCSSCCKLRMHLVLLVSLLILMSERDTPTYTQGSEDQSDGMNENVDFVLHSLDMV